MQQALSGSFVKVSRTVECLEPFSKKRLEIFHERSQDQNFSHNTKIYAKRTNKSRLF